MAQVRNHHFWLRAESKQGEHRTILLPTHVQQLLRNGHTVTVEESVNRCVPINDYATIPGVKVVPEGSWHSAPEGTIISGLKELLEDGKPISGTHLYFAHCFKGQSHAPALLGQFKQGNGQLYDLEFLVDDNGRRVAAFGKAAGAVGMAVGALVWAFGKAHPSADHPSLDKTYPTYAELASYVKEKLAAHEKPKVLIVGALGRVGQGAVGMCRSLGIEPVQWDLAETSGKPGPFNDILDFDIFLNTIYLSPNLSPDQRFVFLNKESINKKGRKLRTIVDVSCDPNNPSNPLPIYQETTSFEKPSYQLIGGANRLDLVSIDHFPSMVPAESSMEFADQLLPHLLQFDQTSVWSRAIKLFEEKRDATRQ